MTIGQLIAGPLSDAIGRKRILFTGIIIYFWEVYCALPHKVLNGFSRSLYSGYWGFRSYVASISIVRDKYSGAQMARIMS